ncbi:PREDICTED: ubiquitin-conjugating enzyme E2 R1 [Bison bison bison]|uniref:Ubiquitin-conjugating enzyme E2 R1 n=1 Tax=Bison bison bison TaxID=43346 RepID=A0A6P3HKP5_BISBB|nr:PREDICTED: ubiquitin-conjugating enzyme E2 R1 [Bison bison bison]
MGAEGTGTPSEMPWTHSPKIWEARAAPSRPSPNPLPEQVLSGPRFTPAAKGRGAPEAGGSQANCCGWPDSLSPLLSPHQARLKFPIDYPYSPPAFRFLTKMWHPNIYETGDVCISILHPPVDDPQSGELPSERWNPTQNVRTILLSVISLLNEPNTFSPANVDASVMYRKWKESKGKDREYTDIIRTHTHLLCRCACGAVETCACGPASRPHGESSREPSGTVGRKQVLGTKVDAERDGVKVPTTLAEYCVKTKAPVPDEGSDLFYDDYYEDGEAEADSCFGDDEDDSGTEES